MSLSEVNKQIAENAQSLQSALYWLERAKGIGDEQNFESKINGLIAKEIFAPYRSELDQIKVKFDQIKGKISANGNLPQELISNLNAIKEIFEATFGKMLRNKTIEEIKKDAATYGGGHYIIVRQMCVHECVEEAREYIRENQLYINQLSSKIDDSRPDNESNITTLLADLCRLGDTFGKLGKRVDCIRMLVEEGADPGQQNIEPLFAVCTNSLSYPNIRIRTQIVRFFLEAGANPNGLYVSSYDGSKNTYLPNPDILETEARLFIYAGAKVPVLRLKNTPVKEALEIREEALKEMNQDVRWSSLDRELNVEIQTAVPTMPRVLVNIVGQYCDVENLRVREIIRRCVEKEAARNAAAVAAVATAAAVPKPDAAKG